MLSKKFWAFVRDDKCIQYKIIATEASVPFVEVYGRHAIDGWEFMAMSPSYEVVEDIVKDWMREWGKTQ